MGEFSLDKGLASFQASLTSAFQAVDKEGMRLIPLVQSGSKWSMHWKAVDKNIAMNAMKNGRGCPSWSAGDTHMEQAYRSMISSMRQAYADAGLPYPLEYVHIGHDEATETKTVGLLIGNGESEYSEFDRSYIRARMAEGDGAQMAFQKIMSGEIYRRVKVVQDSLGGNVKVLIHGDMWDPQANGGNPQKTFLESEEKKVSVRIAPNGAAWMGIAALPGLSAEQKTFLKQHLVVMPWIYARTWKPSPDGDEEYKPDVTFAYLAGNGFSVVYEGAVTTGDNPLNNGAIEAIHKYARAAERRPNGILGFASMHWGASGYDTSVNCWKTMEYMVEANRREETAAIP